MIVKINTCTCCSIRHPVDAYTPCSVCPRFHCDAVQGGQCAVHHQLNKNILVRITTQYFLVSVVIKNKFTACKQPVRTNRRISLSVNQSVDKSVCQPMTVNE